MELQIYQVDAFTSELFKGNPAGVCITDSALEESLMLAIAAEMAVSETAFLSLDTMQLKWFTPKVEVKLCGHGTLAVAHVLKSIGMFQCGDSIAFNTLSGVLTAELNSDSIDLAFPAAELDFSVDRDADIIRLLGLSDNDIVDYGMFDTKQFIVVNDEKKLLELQPDFNALKARQGRGILVTAKSSDKQDFTSRYFAPWVGVDEDPVTGSAHCALGVYWADKLNKGRMQGYQASSRGGYVGVELLSPSVVKLSGCAVTALSGTMTV